MKYLISIESKTTEAGDFDDIPEEWAEDRQAWVEIEPLKMDELLQMEKVGSKTTHKITCNEWLANVTAEMRIIHGTRTFEITSVINVGERNRKTEILCTEVI